MADTTYVDNKEPRVDADWLNDINDLFYTTFGGSQPAATDGNFLVGDGTNYVAESGATARTSLGVAIGTDVQAYDAGLADIAGLAVTDGNVIVGDGNNWVAESGATARTSLGLGNAATFDEATQANQEAETADKIVCSDTQHHHPTAAKAWGKFQVDGTVDGSYNVTSVDDDGTGDFGINYTTAFSDANYVFAACTRSSDVFVVASGDYLGASTDVLCVDDAGSTVDPTRVLFVSFGDQ